MVTPTDRRSRVGPTSRDIWGRKIDARTILDATGAEALLDRRGTRVFTSLPPWLARVNFFGWLDRADMTFAWRVDREAPRRGESPRPGGS